MKPIICDENPCTFTKDDLCFCRGAWDKYRELVKEVKKTNKKGVSPAVGMGLFAGQRIRSGSVVVECTGTRMPMSGILMGDDKFNFDRDRDEYMITTFSGRMSVDASLVSSNHKWKYINHSCVPNCKYYTVDLAEDDPNISDPIEVIFVYALRDIEEDEQLTCSYDWLIEKSLTRDKCECGNINCSELVGVRGYPLVEEEVCDGEGPSGDEIGTKTMRRFVLN